MDTTHCINNNTWELYAANKLAGEELAALQKHASTCELCSDIKEGIDVMPNPALLGKKVGAINQQVDDYLAKKKTKKIPLWYWSAAAVLLISLGIGWMLSSNDTDNNTSVKNTPTITDEVADTIAKNTPPKKDNKEKTPVSIPPEQENRKKLDGDNSIPTKDKFRPADTEVKNKEGRDSKEFDTFKDIELLTDAEKENKLLDKKNIVNDSAYKLGTRELNRSVTSKSVRSKKVLPSAVFNNYFNNSNLALENDFNWSRETEAVDSLNYYEALNQYNNNSLKLSISNLDSIILNLQSAYYERALLLKAKVFIKQNQNKKAKELLNTLLLLKGKLKQEAEELLKTLK
jgi:hypothetical protein